MSNFLTRALRVNVEQGTHRAQGLGVVRATYPIVMVVMVSLARQSLEGDKHIHLDPRGDIPRMAIRRDEQDPWGLRIAVPAFPMAQE